MPDTIEALEAHLEHDPDDLDAYVRLKRLLQAEQDHARVATLVESRAERTPDDREGAKLFHEAARIVSYYLREDDRTVGLLARALDRDPYHEESAEDLERMLEVTGDARRHAAVLERRAKRLADIGAEPTDIALVHQRVGELFEHDLGRPDKALAHYRVAYELDPTNVAAIYAAREIHRLSGNLTATATLLEMEANAETDPERRRALRHELAHLAAEALRDEDRAVRALSLAATDDPRDVETLHAYALALHRRASTRPGSDASARDLAEMADVLVRVSTFVDEPTAITFLESALDAAPAHEAALVSLEALCERFGSADRLPVRWVGYLSAGGAGERARARRHALADAYVAAERPEDAIICLEPLLDESDAEAASRLVELYKKVGRTDGLPKALRISVSGTEQLASGPERIEALRELLRVARDARDTQETRRIADELLALEPSDQGAFDVLVLTLASKADHAALLALHRRLGADERLPAARRLEAWRAAASVAKERLHDHDAAIDAWRAIAALAPEDVGARRALRDRLRAAERHGELAEALAHAAEGDDEDRVELLRDLLELAVQPEVAASLVDRAAMAGATRGVRDATVLERAIDAADRAGRFEDAIAWLRERAADADTDDEKSALLLRAARIADTKAHDPRVALALLDARAALVPLDLALTDDAIRLARAVGDRARVLALLRSRAALVPETERALALREAGRYADEEAEQPEVALELAHALLARSPGDVEAEDAVRGLLTRLGRPGALVDFLKARAREDGAREVALLREAWRVAETTPLAADVRIEVLEALLAAAHDAEALAALLDLLRAEGRHEALVVHLGAAIEHATTEDEKTAHAMERITILADVLGDDARALAALEALRELAPDFAPAVGKMVTIHERRGDHEALTRTLRTQLTVARGPSQRLETARRILAVHDGPRPDDEAAIEALRAWRLAAPDDASPVERLAPLLEARGAFADALEAYDALLALAPDDAERDARRRKAAELCVERLGDVDGAMSRLLAGALEGDTLAEPELRRVAEAHDRWRELAKALEAIGRAVDAPAEAHRRLVEVADLYETRAGDATAALEATIAAYELGIAAAHLLSRIDALAAAASAYERLFAFHVRRAEDVDANATQLGSLLAALDVAVAHLEPSFAKRALARAIELAGDDATAIASVEKAATAGDARRAELGLVRAIVADLDARAASSDEPTRRALEARAARLLMQSGRAREAFERVLASTESDTDAALHALLVEAAVAAGAGRVLHEALERRVDEALDAQVAKTSLRARAALYEREEAHSDAADLLQRLSSMSPADDALRDAYRKALARAGRHQDLLSSLDASLRRAKTTEERLPIARERAKLWEGPLANRYEALDAWKKVLALAPDDVEASSAVRRLSPKTRVGADELESAPELDGLPPRPSRMPSSRPSASPSRPITLGDSASRPIPPPPRVPTSLDDVPSETVPTGTELASEPAERARPSSARSPVEMTPNGDEARFEAPPASAARAIEPVSATQSLDARASIDDLLDAPIEDDFDRPSAPRSNSATLSQELVDALDAPLDDDDDEDAMDASELVEDASDLVEDVTDEDTLIDDGLLDEDDPSAFEAPPSSVARISPPPPPPRRR